MIRTELKRAFCSKTFWVTCGIILAMLAFGSSDCLPNARATIIIPRAWWDIYLHAVRVGMKTVMPLFYSIVVVIPYALSYRKERDSGYQKLILLKTTRRAYLGAKILTVASSAFVAMLLPCLCWIPVCRLLGVTDPSYDTVRDVMHFALSFYDEHPGWYMVMYAFHAATLAAVFALFGLGLSAVIRNKYLALLIPFCYSIFSSSILEVFLGKSVAALDLMPFQLYYYKQSYPMGYWTAPIYEAVLLVVALTLFLGGDYHAGKA